MITVKTGSAVWVRGVMSGITLAVTLGSLPAMAPDSRHALFAIPVPESARAVIVLTDGTELTGEIIEETDDAVVIRSAFGRSTIQKSRIKEIKRGQNPLREEFEDRYARAADSVSKLFQVAQWALENNLVVEHRRALGKVIELDSNHMGARKALGHARLDGTWVDEQRVNELLRQGYVLDGLELVKKAASGPSVNPEGSKPGTTSVGGGTGSADATPKPTLKRERRELTDAEKAKAAKAREDRRKEAQKHARKKELEYKGVPWEKAWKIRSPIYDITCNSTKEVADTYRWIMDHLYVELSNRFNQKHQRGGRLAVFVYRNREEFQLRTGSGAGGFYRPDTQELHAYHGTFGLTGTTYSVLAHEGTHQFQGRVLGNMWNLPIWIIEGIAVYFGDGSKLDWEKKKIVTGIVPRDRLFHIQEKMSKGTHEPLRTLIALPQARFGGSQYADGWSLVNFLFSDKAGFELIGRYWLLGTERKVSTSDFVTLAERYFGSMEELERKWIEFTLAIKPDPAGRVEDDGYFVSDDFSFETQLPAPDWEFVLDTNDNATIVKMVLPGTDASVNIRFLNNQDEAKPEAFVANMLAATKARYTDVESRKASINGLDGFVVDYADPVAESVGPEGKGEATDKAEPKEGGATGGDTTAKPEVPVDQVKGPRMRYRSYLIVDLTKALMIRCSCRYEDFGSLEADFQAASDNFEMIIRNRW